MSKFRASNSSTEKKSNISIKYANERLDEETSTEKAEKYIRQCPSHGVDYYRDPSEDVEEEEDPEEESGEELEEDPEEDPEIADKTGEVSGNEVPAFAQASFDNSRDQLEDVSEEDPEEESGEELEEDPEENPDADNQSGEVLDNEVPAFAQPSFDDSTDQSKDIEEEEDPEEESDEELEEDPEENPDTDNQSGEVSDNEVPAFAQPSFDDPTDQSEDIEEEDPEEESGGELEEDPEEYPESTHETGEVSDNEVPSFAEALCFQSPKKCKQEGLESQKLESVPSRIEFSNDCVVSGAPTDKLSSEEESAGSSGKRRRSRWEPQPDWDGTKEADQTCKRRKTRWSRWSSDDTHLTVPVPLQLPDIIEDFIVGSDKDPNFQKLKAELLEINRKLQMPLLGGRPKEERSPSPEPIYNNQGIRINTREVRLCQKRQDIISKLIKLNSGFNPPDNKPPKLFKKLYIPVKEYPEYNFVGLIIGPRGNTLKRMIKETQAKILLRGKGSSKTPSKDDSEEEDLHVYIESDNQKSLDAAVGMVEKLLIPVEDGRNEHKLAQLKELAVLNGKLRDANVCSVCGDPGHRKYACPNLQSTFNMDTFGTCSSNSLSAPTCPRPALFPQSDSIQDSGSSLNSTQKRQARLGKQISDKHLYVGYLSPSIDDNRLTELFSPFGKITEAKVVKDRTTGISRGYGFVTFEDSMDAALAIARLNGFRIDGKILKVSIAGFQPNNEFPCPGVIPLNPGPAAVFPNVQSQTNQSGPLHFMLPEHQSTFLDSSSATEMFSCTLNSVHGDHNKAPLVFTPPGNTLIPLDFSYSSNMHFPGNFSDQSLFSSSNSTAEFLSDPGNLASRFQPHFMTPTYKSSAFSDSDPRR